MTCFLCGKVFRSGGMVVSVFKQRFRAHLCGKCARDVGQVAAVAAQGPQEPEAGKRDKALRDA